MKYACKCGQYKAFGKRPAPCQSCSKCGTTLLREGDAWVPATEHEFKTGAKRCAHCKRTKGQVRVAYAYARQAEHAQAGGATP